VQCVEVVVTEGRSRASKSELGQADPRRDYALTRY